MAYHNAIPVEKIMQRAGWTNARTFAFLQLRRSFSVLDKYSFNTKTTHNLLSGGCKKSSKKASLYPGLLCFSKP
jgi:hypothetical protein